MPASDFWRWTILKEFVMKKITLVFILCVLSCLFCASLFAQETLWATQKQGDIKVIPYSRAQTSQLHKEALNLKKQFKYFHSSLLDKKEVFERFGNQFDFLFKFTAPYATCVKATYKGVEAVCILTVVRPFEDEDDFQVYYGVIIFSNAKSEAYFQECAEYDPNPFYVEILSSF